jgi:replication factor C large subunit
MWVQKYRPESLDEYRGASNQKKEIREWAQDWNQGDKPVLLHGQAGTGKTSLVEALANDLGYELVETNASDVRTKSKLKSELKEATRQASFYGGEKIILVDEVDGMGSGDRGGTRELVEIVDETRFPLVMTANDAYDSKIKTLRNRAKTIKLDSVHTNSIAAHLREILENEGIDYEDGSMKRVARQAGGQMRSAINDLEAIARGQQEVTKEDIENVSGRDSNQDIFQALKVVFKTMNPENAERATDNLDEDPGTFLEWVRENVPREYTRGKDVEQAYDYVSRADLFNGRIRRSQNWKLLKYLYKFSTVGVALSKEEKYGGYTKYQYPSKIRQMGSSKASRKRMDAVTSKIGEKLHISGREAVKTLPFISRLMEEHEELGEQLELEEDEIDFVRKF